MFYRHRFIAFSKSLSEVDVIVNSIFTLQVKKTRFREVTKVKCKYSKRICGWVTHLRKHIMGNGYNNIREPD